MSLSDKIFGISFVEGKDMGVISSKDVRKAVKELIEDIGLTSADKGIRFGKEGIINYTKLELLDRIEEIFGEELTK